MVGGQPEIASFRSEIPFAYKHIDRKEGHRNYSDHKIRDGQRAYKVVRRLSNRSLDVEGEEHLIGEERAR